MYKTVFDRMPIAAVYLGNDGKVLLWNKMATKLLGYESEYATGKNIDIIIPERFKARHNAGYAAAIKSGITKFIGKEPLKAKAIKKDGSKIILSVKMSMIKDGDIVNGIAEVMEKAE